ncbi:MAG: N-acetyltransferase [Chloroflexi bacterium]|nr:N-acetyltransferase [Chloroflexota bacterium]
MKVGKDLKAEKASVADAPKIHEMVNHYADKGEMLHRPITDIYENLRDYFVVRDGGDVLGCGALHILWSDLAEVKSVAVSEERQSQGVGSKIVEACLKEAKALGIPLVFCLTYRPGFFERFGFQTVDIMTLPRKVFGECARCPKFPDCDEIAMIRHMD